MACRSIRTDISAQDSKIPLGLEGYDHAHSIRAIVGGRMAVVPSVDAQGSPPLKFKSMRSILSSTASVGAKRSIRTNRFLGSFKEDDATIEHYFMHLDDNMDLEEAPRIDSMAADMTIGQFQNKCHVKRKRVKVTEVNDRLLVDEPGRPSEVDDTHRQSGETGSDLDEPIIFLRKSLKKRSHKKKHKSGGDSFSSHHASAEEENKDEACLVSSAISLEDGQGIMHLARIKTESSEVKTHYCGVPSETEDSYKAPKKRSHKKKHRSGAEFSSSHDKSVEVEDNNEGCLVSAATLLVDGQGIMHLPRAEAEPSPTVSHYTGAPSEIGNSYKALKKRSDKEKHKSGGDCSSSHNASVEVENNDGRCSVSAPTLLVDSQGIMHLARIEAESSQMETHCCGTSSESGSSYKALISQVSGESDISKYETCYTRSSASCQLNCEVKPESSNSDCQSVENAASLSPISGISDSVENFDSSKKPSVEESVSLLEYSSSIGDLNSGQEQASELSQNLPAVSLIECQEDMPQACYANTTQSITSEPDAGKHLDQKDRDCNGLAAEHSAPKQVNAEVYSISSHMSGLETGTQQSLLNVSNALSLHSNSKIFSSNLVEEMNNNDTWLDISKNLGSPGTLVPTKGKAALHLDMYSVDSIKPGPTCQTPAAVSASITEDFDTKTSTTLDSAPTEDAHNCFPSQLKNYQSSADATQTESSQKDYRRSSSTADMECLSRDLPKRENHIVDQIASEDTPNVSYNRMRSKFSGIDGLEGRRGPNGRRDLGLSQAPKRFPSNRKTLSPTSREKLCFEVNVEELYENMQQFRHKKRLWFGKSTDNSSTTSHKEPLLATSSERGALKSKLTSCQTKGIFKPQCGTQENTSSKDPPAPASRSQDAIKFSERQMRDVESITSKLVAELKSMKSIMSETLNLEVLSSTDFKSITDKIVLAQDSASAVEAMTKRHLCMMNRDFKRFCKIMSKETNSAAVPAATSSSPPKERKVMFADEVGGSLCEIKYFEEPSAPCSLPDSESRETVTL